VGKPEKNRPLVKHLGVDGKIILKMELNCDGKARIGMNQNRDKWQAVVDTLMNFRFP